MSVEPKPKVLRNGESHKPTPMTLSIRQLTRSLAHLGRHFVLPHAGLNGGLWPSSDRAFCRRSHLIRVPFVLALHRKINVADKHLFIALLSEAHRLSGVGILGILR